MHPSKQQSAAAAPAQVNYELSAAASSSLVMFNFSTQFRNNPNMGNADGQPPRLSVAPRSGESILDLAWSPDGRLVAVVTERAIFLYDKLGSVVDYIDPPVKGEILRACSFGWKSSRYLYFGGSQKVVYTWDRKDSKVISSTASLNSTISCIALASDDGKMAVGSTTGSALLHSLKNNTSNRLSAPFVGSINHMAFYPFKKSILASAGDNGSVVFWDVNQKSSPTHIKENAHSSSIQGLAFAPCNKHFYCTVGLDRQLQFHDILQASASSVIQSYEATSPLMSVSVNDEHAVAMGTANGKVLVYDVRMKSIMHTFDTLSTHDVTRLRFQPPKWVTEVAAKEPLISHRNPTLVQQDLRRKLSKPTISFDDPMTMFSPVNNVKNQKRSSQDLLKAMLTSKAPKPPSDGVSTEDDDSPFITTDDAKSASALNGRLRQSSGGPKPILKSSKSLSDMEFADANQQHDYSMTPTPLLSSQPIELSKRNSVPSSLFVPPITGSGAVDNDSNVSNASRKKVSNSTVIQAAPVSTSQNSTPTLHANAPSWSTLKQEVVSTSFRTTPVSDKPLLQSEPAVLKSSSSSSGEKIGGLVGGLVGEETTVLQKPALFTTPHSVVSDVASTINNVLKSDSGATPLDSSTLQYRLLRSVIEECLEDHRQQTRIEIQNMHLELIRQFQIQEGHIAEMLRLESPTAKLMEELVQLRLENQRLRSPLTDSAKDCSTVYTML
ncbi:hypothetical protein BASA83_010965 [Batrachochytrium salamandrivorans]|nr:hypothetical protein BASA83_010965 [Batrachochytrium salamandrivorans]